MYFLAADCLFCYEKLCSAEINNYLLYKIINYLKNTHNYISSKMPPYFQLYPKSQIPPFNDCSTFLPHLTPQPLHNYWLQPGQLFTCYKLEDTGYLSHKATRGPFINYDLSTPERWMLMLWKRQIASHINKNPQCSNSLSFTKYPNVIWENWYIST